MKTWVAYGLLLLIASYPSLGSASSSSSSCAPQLNLLAQLNLDADLKSVLLDYANLIFTQESTATDTSLHITLKDLLEEKGQELERLLEKVNGTPHSKAEAKEFILAVLKSLRDESDPQEAARIEAEAQQQERKELDELLVDGSKAIFREVTPGTVYVQRADGPANITRSFGLMASHVTQIIYKEIAEAANAKFPDKYKIKPDPSFDGESFGNSYEGKNNLFPVNQLSRKDVDQWISAANDLIKAGDPVVDKIFPQLRPGQFLDLPTFTEYEYVLHGASRQLNSSEAPLNLSDKELDRKIWHFDNSKLIPHKVAEKESFRIDGQDYYDLLGLTSIMVKDASAERSPGGNDPLVIGNVFSNYTITGGYWHSRVDGLKDIFNRRHSDTYVSGFKGTGFRLVVRSDDSYFSKFYWDQSQKKLFPSK